MERVVRGDRVQVLCLTQLDDGSWIGDDAERATPLWIKAGQTSTLSAITHAVIGMKVGERKTFTIPPEQAFGRPDERKLFHAPLRTLPKDCHVGDTVSFTSPSFEGDVLVRDIRNNQALLDANHPLAGRTLHVDLKLLAIG